jgi:hypothetical protein
MAVFKQPDADGNQRLTTGEAGMTFSKLHMQTITTQLDTNDGDNGDE